MSENKNLLAYSARPGSVYWRDPMQYAPPVGRKLLLLTEGGVAVIGLWHKGGGFVAWSPLPKRGDKKVMDKRSKWTTDEVIAVLLCVVLCALVFVFLVGAGSVMLKESEAKTSGGSECVSSEALEASLPKRVK